MTDVSEIAHNPTDWIPTPKQKKFLEAAREVTGKPTILNLCKKAGIQRSTFYDWLRNDDDFVKAWDALWVFSIDGAMPAIVEAQIAKATGSKRDTRAAQFLADLRGKMVKHVDITSGGAPLKGYVAVTPDDWDGSDEE